MLPPLALYTSDHTSYAPRHRLFTAVPNDTPVERTHQTHWQPALLGRSAQRAGYGAALGHPARAALDAGAAHGLYRVVFFFKQKTAYEMAEHRGEIRLGGEEQLVVQCAGALRPQPDL